MTAEDFTIFWTSTYPDTVPINHYFRHNYADRWFRVHSLPESKRYPAAQEDWDILLYRQNTILTDLLGDGAPILIVTGESHTEGYTELHPVDEVPSIQSFEFIRLEPIDLHSLAEEQYEKGQMLTPMFAEQVWESGKFDEVLKDVAEWNLVAFFISIPNNCIIAPYDGGMDIILKDSHTRDLYKEKYKQWLSSHPEGL